MLLLGGFQDLPSAILNFYPQLMVVRNLALTKMYLADKNPNHLNKYYEKFSLCFIVCNDLDVANKLRISG